MLHPPDYIDRNWFIWTSKDRKNISYCNYDNLHKDELYYVEAMHMRRVIDGEYIDITKEFVEWANTSGVSIGNFTADDILIIRMKWGDLSGK